ncbi:hypothetical protein ACFQ60_45710 [Streptomyces zhihengii]
MNTALAGDASWDEAWRLLVRLDADGRTAPHLDAVVTHPYLRPSLLDSWDGRADLPRFMAVAAAAALRAGVEATLRWDQPDPWSTCRPWAPCGCQGPDGWSSGSGRTGSGWAAPRSRARPAPPRPCCGRGGRWPPCPAATAAR